MTSPRHNDVILHSKQPAIWTMFTTSFFSLSSSHVRSSFSSDMQNNPKILREEHVFFKIFVGHISIFGATNTPVLDSKSLFPLGTGICDIHSWRFTSGETPLPVYNASIAVSQCPTCVFQQIWDARI